MRTAGDAPGRVTRGREPGFDRSGCAWRAATTRIPRRARVPAFETAGASPARAPERENVPRRT